MFWVSIHNKGLSYKDLLGLKFKTQGIAFFTHFFYKSVWYSWEVVISLLEGVLANFCKVKACWCFPCKGFHVPLTFSRCCGPLPLCSLWFFSSLEDFQGKKLLVNFYSLGHLVFYLYEVICSHRAFSLWNIVHSLPRRKREQFRIKYSIYMLMKPAYWASSYLYVWLLASYALYRIKSSLL